MQNLFGLLRVHQYLKNLFVFVPAFFSGMLLQNQYLLQSLGAFLIFSATASAVYIFNDILDRERDRAHPTKRFRPIAAGSVSIPVAVVTAVQLLFISLTAAYFTNPSLMLLLLFYVSINLVYTLGLKHQALYDVMIIAVGFVIRIFAGALATGIPVTNWVVIITFLLALFLALSKRKHDCHILETTGRKMRPSLDGYNVLYLNASMAIVGAVTIMTYILYTIDMSRKNGFEYLYMTVFFVVFGILRYMQISFVDHGGAEPTRTLARDGHLLFSVSLFVGFFGFTLYH